MPSIGLPNRVCGIGNFRSALLSAFHFIDFSLFPALARVDFSSHRQNARAIRGFPAVWCHAHCRCCARPILKNSELNRLDVWCHRSRSVDDSHNAEWWEETAIRHRAMGPSKQSFSKSFE